MSIIHKELAEGRWFTLTFLDQMANIGREVERTILWRKKGDNKENLRAFYRALELLDLTIQDSTFIGNYAKIKRTFDAFVSGIGRPYGLQV